VARIRKPLSTDGRKTNEIAHCVVAVGGFAVDPPTEYGAKIRRLCGQSLKTFVASVAGETSLKGAVAAAAATRGFCRLKNGGRPSD
jgi:hypothetical protein